MNPFRVHKGRVALLYRANVDTDQIIPKQFLKRIEKTGFGEFVSSIGDVAPTARSPGVHSEPAALQGSKHPGHRQDFWLRIHRNQNSCR